MRDVKLKLKEVDGEITGGISFECEKEIDFHAYGEIGYAGTCEGQIYKVPNSDKYYKWNEFFHKWEDITMEIFNSMAPKNEYEQSWSDKLFNNAAFDPVWGSNTSGGNYLSNDRHRNGATDLWGNPEMITHWGLHGKLGGKKDALEYIDEFMYIFSLNLKAVVRHIKSIDNALSDYLKKDKMKPAQEKDIRDLGYKVDRLAIVHKMITIRIEKVHSWSYFYNNGHIDQSGIKVLKDTTIRQIDSLRVQLDIKERGKLVKKYAKDKFEKKIR